MKDDRGQLRSYFNACPTVKLGILTDGLRYELYADSDKPNMMDETAFLKLDFAKIAANGAIDDNTLGGIAAIRKVYFNPEDVGAEAKRKLLFESIVETIKSFKSEPPDDFIEFVLARSTVGRRINKFTQAIIDTNRDVIRSAMEVFVAQQALARFGYAPKDVVRTPPTELAPIGINVAPERENDQISPSPKEMELLEYAKKRLYFLVRNEVLFQEMQKINYRKSRTSFRVYYARPNNGSMFDYKENGKPSLQFPALKGKEIEYTHSAELDECLLNAFRNRVTEAGISFDSPPVLRTIQGGQSTDAA
jgi:hypothetical protein